MKIPQQLAGEIEARVFVLQASGLSTVQARKRAGREIAARERAKTAGAAPSPAPPSASGLSRAHDELLAIFNRVIGSMWRHCNQMKRYVRKADRAKAAQPSTPPMGSNPVVVVEPTQPLSADPKLQKAFPAPLVVTGFANARIIPNSEFPIRYTDPATENWRASIQQNEAIAKERAARSLQLQNRNRAGSRYIG
jgi:hypothetical protein